MGLGIAVGYMLEYGDTNIASYQMASRHTIIERGRRLRLRNALEDTQKYQHELALMVLNYQKEHNAI